MTSTPLQKRVQGQAYQIVYGQLAGVLILAFIALLVSGMKSSFSVFAGGMAYGLANLIFVWQVFRFTGAKAMTAFVLAFFTGEMIKLVLSAILFLLIVKFLPVSLLSTLIGLIGAIVSFWIVCLLRINVR